MAADAGIENLLTYCSSLAVEFTARRNRVRAFVQHNLTSGTANEAILRDVLSSISAGVLSVETGFVCNPLQNTSSRQCDILIYDNRYPVVYSEGNVKIVWPESVLSVIEVKTAMNSVSEFEGAVQNIVSAKATDANQHIVGIVFAFKGLSVDLVVRTLASSTAPAHLLPLAVILFDQGVVVQQSNILDCLRWGSGDGTFEAHRFEGDDASGKALTYFILIFLVGVPLLPRIQQY